VTAVAKLAAFAGVIAVLFGGAALAGAAIGPEPETDSGGETHGEAPEAHGEGGETHGRAADPVRGLAVADEGLRVVVDEPELRRGRAQTLRFRIVDADGATVRHFDVEHEKRMHLILARRDLTGFQHLHPEQGADGAWTTRARLDQAGSYRLFADFSRDGEAQTLASDLRVDGPADLQPLPAPRSTTVTDGGYDVELAGGNARPGQEADLRFTISGPRGRPVRTEPYLGAGGHLVALREGDLAFLHVHPTADDAVRFAATFPTAGRYRLFLQFKHEGRVQTAAFTLEVR
jgi:hypothetical protein